MVRNGLMTVILAVGLAACGSGAGDASTSAATGTPAPVASPMAGPSGAEPAMPQAPAGAAATSPVAVLGDPPAASGDPKLSIDLQPSSVPLKLGRTATFAVNARGSLPLAYQWQRNGVAIPGATSSAYTTPVVTVDDVGDRFTARVTDRSGSVLSDEVGFHPDEARDALSNAERREVSCTDYFEIDTRFGRFTSNVWNKQAAGGAQVRQCIVARGPMDAREYGWSWDWPSNSGTVFAYPETVIGWKPWNGGGSTHARLPIRIRDVGTFVWSYEVETVSNGKQNLATSMWLTRSGATGIDPNPTDISTELMVWTDGFDFLPAGTRIATVAVDGIEFEVWHVADWGDAAGVNSNRWSYVTYRATDRRLSVSLDIRKILVDAVDRGLISPDHFVSNIEIGNEVMSGSGQTWVKSLAVDIR